MGFFDTITFESPPEALRCCGPMHTSWQTRDFGEAMQDYVVRADGFVVVPGNQIPAHLRIDPPDGLRFLVADGKYRIHDYHGQHFAERDVEVKDGRVVAIWQVLAAEGA